MPAEQACPCGQQRAGRPLAYAECCGRYIDAFDLAPAPDAEQLMRSRYTAFVRERGDYLLATWHASTRPASIEFEPGARWLGLTVREHRVSGPNAAQVQFLARQRSRSGRAHRLHERSRFVREGDGRWYYVDGQILE